MSEPAEETHGVQRTVGQADVASLPVVVWRLLATTVRRAILPACAVVFASNHPTISVTSASEPEPDSVAEAFTAADVDGNRVLSFEEFIARPGEEQVHRRDFHLFDFNRDERLTRDEFAAIPGLAPPSKRGAIPDPFDHLVDAAEEAIKEALHKAGIDADSNVPTSVFLKTVAVSLDPIAHHGVDPSWEEWIDPNHDGRVTKPEARRFAEIHLGVRGPEGELLRTPNGRVVALSRFHHFDSDRNSTLFVDEYRQHRGAELTPTELKTVDPNRDGIITLQEFAHPEGPGFEDPVEWFRLADTNLDTFVELPEAEGAIEVSRHSLISCSFRAFDDNHDSKLSLDEYRLSMLGNPIVRWEHAPRDDNDDYTLTFDEFHFDWFGHCELLRLFYFHRLDANCDKKLSQSEFPFRTQPGRRFHLVAADGSEMRLLHTNPDYPHCGSPAVSPDGKAVAFDGRHGGESLRQQRILMISIDGTGFRDVCEGLMPTWSPDGQRFACSRYEPAGIWIVDADGSNGERVADGWAAQWSPDGKTIAFTNHNGVWAYDVTSGKIREVLSASQHQYRTIYWNMCWSPDSRRLAFKARTDDGAEIASISMVGDDPDLRVHYSGDGSIEPDTSWSPDGRRIVFSMEAPGSSHRLLYELDPTTNEPPVLVKGIDTSLTYKTSCFTADGKWIIAATMDLGGRPRNAAIDQ